MKLIVNLRKEERERKTCVEDGLQIGSRGIGIATQTSKQISSDNLHFGPLMEALQQKWRREKIEAICENCKP